jgi:hypothetical protein
MTEQETRQSIGAFIEAAGITFSASWRGTDEEDGWR